MRKCSFTYSILGLVLVLTSCASHPKKTEPLIESKVDFFSNNTWAIQPGAKVHILVQGEPTFSKENLVIDSEGFIYYPPLGKIRATKWTPEELRNHITKRLSENIFNDPKVSVTIEHNAKIYVLGEVKNPGLFEIHHPITILEAVKLAGGFSDSSQRDVIRVARQTPEGEKIKMISLKKIESIWIKNENIYIMPNDVIMVN